MHSRNISIALAQPTANYLENFEAGDIKNADEVLLLVLRLQRLVAAADQPQKHSGVDGFGQSCYCVDNLEQSVTLQSSKSRTAVRHCSRMNQQTIHRSS